MNHRGQSSNLKGVRSPVYCYIQESKKVAVVNGVVIDIRKC